MIIDITGFGYSGSGAYLDLLKEYSETEFPWPEEFEMSILHNVDGIMDLEYKLKKKHCRIFDSDVAIKRFLHLVKEHYQIRGALRGVAYPICLNYIDKLVGIKFKSQSIYDQIYFNNPKTVLTKYLNFAISALLKNPLSKKFVKLSTSEKCKLSNLNEKYISYNPDNFLEATRELMCDLLSTRRKDVNKYLLTDHLLPPDMPSPFMHYIAEDLKCIVVRRDPRDTYILAKEIYKGKVPIPTDSIDDFIWFYKQTIENTIIQNTDSIMNFSFEELVYEYDMTVRKVEDFCHLKDHKYTLSKFDPNQSINNTQLFKLYNSYLSDVQKIEKELEKSLFDFDKYSSRTRNKVNIF